VRVLNNSYKKNEAIFSIFQKLCNTANKVNEEIKYFKHIYSQHNLLFLFLLILFSGLNCVSSSCCCVRIREAIFIGKNQINQKRGAIVLYSKDHLVGSSQRPNKMATKTTATTTTTNENSSTGANSEVFIPIFVYPTRMG
jgi:hypothetical protein